MNLFPYTLFLLFVSVATYCPPGYTYNSILEKCYEYNSHPLAFLAAEHSCNTLGGHLASIDNVYELVQVTGYAVSNPVQFWSGGNLLMSTNWTWTTGLPVVYTKWAANQPTDPSINQCLAIDPTNGMYYKGLCSSAKPFVCTIVLGPATTTMTTVSTTVSSYSATCQNHYCPAGYAVFWGNCKCYRYYNEHMLYPNATAKCTSEKATLVKIDSPDLDEFLLSMTGLDGRGPWIGLSCTSDDPKSCTWFDGTPLTGYINFSAGSPDKTNPYGFMYNSHFSTRGKWGTASGGEGAVFCQKESSVVS